MVKRAKPAIPSLDLQEGDVVVVGPNPVLMAEGTVATFLFYHNETGPPIIEVADRGRFLVPERSLTLRERPPAPMPEPEPMPEADLSRAQSDALLARMAERKLRGATPLPSILPARRTAIMPLAWETRTEPGEPTLPQQIKSAQWDATGLAAWVARLTPGNDHESVALHELRRAAQEMTFWLAEFRCAREAVTA